MLTRKHSLVGDTTEPIVTFVSLESACEGAWSVFDVLLGVKSRDLKQINQIEKVGKYELLKFLGEGKFGK